MSRLRLSWLAPLAMLLLASAASAQPSNEDDGVNQSVARVSFLQGTVSYNRGDDPDQWDAASINFPMTLGDRVYAASDGRAEIELRGASVLMAGATELSALNLTPDLSQFSLSVGTATFRIRRLSDQDMFEVDTPNAAVTFDRPGIYRIDVDADGNTKVRVRQGSARVASGGGEVPLRTRDEMEITGLDSPQYDVYDMSRDDMWDRWVDGRSRATRAIPRNEYVNEDIEGVADLDAYGTWQNVPDYGTVWAPTSVEADWQPYRSGRWIWQDPWGWTWVASEPWGWAPYHYGRWVTYRSRWFWVPVARRAERVSYSPALVAFVGGGPGWSLSVSTGGGFVGWFPLAPRDPFLPWWGRRATTVVNVTNVTYVNRASVTIVNRNTFISGTSVARNVVLDREVVRQVVAAPVLRGPLPVIPTRAALRVSADVVRDVPRPSERTVSRAVVTRAAPPPAPVRFDRKVEVIRQNGGAPINAAAATRISTEDARGETRRVQPVRPVAAESGRVVLESKRGGDTPRPQAVAPGAASRGTAIERPARVEDRPDRPAARTDERPAGDLRARPTAAPEARPVTRSDERPAARPTDRPFANPEARPTARSVERPPARVDERPAGRVEERPAPRATVQPVVRDERPAPRVDERRPAATPELRQSAPERPEPRRVESREPARAEPPAVRKVEEKKAEEKRVEKKEEVRKPATPTPKPDKRERRDPNKD